MEYHIKTSPTPESYYKNGREFCETAWRCFGGREGNVVVDGEIRWLPVPTVVNAAFSCEMQFKALLLLEKKPIPKGSDGHNLKKLFNALSEDTQKRVSAFCMPKGSSNPFDSFMKILETHEKDFTEIRYYMERAGWKEMSPITMLTVAENLTIITRALINAEHNALEDKK